ncbi:phage integrase family protein [Rhizobium sp. PP-F2F-G48]|uniref:tyrosine-type recombinase/integrase n=1 Tax=Rhizobium sp. PP-F2F-G48 TaxID=2135651 RepID=UPI0010455489|nr:tyrosine-type recombinase/integrase [Rhizobium sp. PP-F2F-G48]TCM56138.1 phage integrase family protein [Rhizobium sp. PP-F2F-G48]
MAYANLSTIHETSNVYRPNVFPIRNEIQPQAITFAEAAASYMQNGGCGRYLPRIIEHFDGRPLASIFPFDVRKMAEDLYPVHKGSTRNRQAIAPARAVIMHAYERGWCNIIHIRRFKEDRVQRVKPASHVWLHTFIRQCEKDGRLDHMAACVLFMSQTGARVSEAVALRWAQVDFTTRTALLLKTKTGTNSMRHLTDELTERLAKLKATASANDRVFRFTNRHSVNERIKAVSGRAGISYKSSHVCGRHAFATNAMDAGADIRTAMAAGDWKSSSIFLEIYVHPRTNAGRLVADRFNGNQYNGDM